MAANRDERLDRSWDPPAAWWPKQPDVIGGRDRLAGGTWLGFNKHGLAAAVLNRADSLGPALGKRSRGDLPLIALSERTAPAAARLIQQLNGRDWRGFSLVVADAQGAMFVCSENEARPRAWALPVGISMITARDPNDLNCPRVRRHLNRFLTATPPRPDNWTAWNNLLIDRSGSADEQLNVAPSAGYGTVCSSFLAWPKGGAPYWAFAAGPPDQAGFHPVS